MQFSLSHLASLLPAEIDFLSMLKFIGVFAAGSILLSLAGRALFGRRSSVNHAFSSAMGILFIYALTIVVYTFNPSGLSHFLSPLPFVQFSEAYLRILPFHTAGFPAICENLLSLVILGFLVNLLDTFLPRGRSVIGWFLLRGLSVILSMALHYGVNALCRTYLPGVLVTYAPILLLGILITMLILGVVNALLSLLLTVVNPILGGIYAFFFSNILGKQLSKSILTSALICGVFYALEHYGYSVIVISAAALASYLPLVVVLLLLWYLIGHFL